jgi:hypothetical protein
VPAVSSGGCNSVKDLAWFHPLEGLSRSRIELVGHGVQMGLSVLASRIGPPAGASVVAAWESVPTSSRPPTMVGLSRAGRAAHDSSHLFGDQFWCNRIVTS